MSTQFRSVTQIGNSAKVQVAPGVKIKRPFPGPAGPDLNPFLMLDYFGPKEMMLGDSERVPPHPHRGFEPVTILFEGAVEHRDSLGNKSVIRGGDVQWLTAGSGLIHAETMMGGKTHTLHGIQLWVNLPKSKKMTKPGYQTIRSHTIPVVDIPYGKARVITGTYGDQKGPAKSGTPVTIVEFSTDGPSEIEIPIPAGWSAGIFVMSGEIEAGENQKGKSGWLVRFGMAGEAIQLKTTKASHFMLLSGKPLFEPVVSHGPFVMNSKQEITQALKDFEAGKMGILKN